MITYSDFLKLLIFSLFSYQNLRLEYGPTFHCLFSTDKKSLPTKDFCLTVFIKFALSFSRLSLPIHPKLSVFSFIYLILLVVWKTDFRIKSSSPTLTQKKLKTRDIFIFLFLFFSIFFQYKQTWTRTKTKLQHKQIFLFFYFFFYN